MKKILFMCTIFFTSEPAFGMQRATVAGLRRFSTGPRQQPVSIAYDERAATRAEEWKRNLVKQVGFLLLGENRNDRAEVLLWQAERRSRSEGPDAGCAYLEKMIRELSLSPVLNGKRKK